LTFSYLSKFQLNADDLIFYYFASYIISENCLVAKWSD